MRKTKDETIDTILVIGNGFDLHCGLHSSFSSYFLDCCKDKAEKFYNAFQYNREEAKRIVSKNDDDLNFWSFLCYVQFYSEDRLKFNGIVDTNWFDVENLISFALTKNSQRSFTLTKIIEDAFIKFDKMRSHSIPERNLISENPYKAFVYYQTFDPCSEYDYLLNELHKFEKSFKNYMAGIVDDQYKAAYESFLNKLLPDHRLVDLINFNYTSIGDNEHIHSETNVHGDSLVMRLLSESIPILRRVVI